MNIRRLMALVFLTALACGCVAASPPFVDRLEEVTDRAVTGDGGNAWGGHQCRLVRTAEGLFTAYTVPGETDGRFDRRWELAHRTDAGWEVIASAPSGREPANIMADPDGRLHIIAWPEAEPHHWTISRDADGGWKVADEIIPGGWEKDHWPYNAAGIGPDGTLVALQSCVLEGRRSSFGPGKFNWAYRAATGKRVWWNFMTTPMPLRNCYAYVLPQPGGGLYIVAVRDVILRDLGMEGPNNRFIFNAFTVWHTPDAATVPAVPVLHKEEPLPDNKTRATCMPIDAYVDTTGRLHVLYSLVGPSTNHDHQVRQLVLGLDQQVLADKSLPEGASPYCRIIQDASKRFYLLDALGQFYVGTNDLGTDFAQPVQLDLGVSEERVYRLAVAVPRYGSPLQEDFIEGVFPSGDSWNWTYFRIRLDSQETGVAEGLPADLYVFSENGNPGALN